MLGYRFLIKSARCRRCANGHRQGAFVRLPGEMEYVRGVNSPSQNVAKSDHVSGQTACSVGTIGWKVDECSSTIACQITQPMLEDDTVHSWLAVLPPQVERVNYLRITVPKPTRSSGWGSNVGPASSGIHDDSPIAKDVGSEIEVLKPAIEWKIFIKKYVVEDLGTNEQVLAVFVIVVVLFSNVVRHIRPCYFTV